MFWALCRLQVWRGTSPVCKSRWNPSHCWPPPNCWGMRFLKRYWLFLKYVSLLGLGQNSEVLLEPTPLLAATHNFYLNKPFIPISLAFKHLSLLQTTKSTERKSLGGVCIYASMLLTNISNYNVTFLAVC